MSFTIQTMKLLNENKKFEILFRQETVNGKSNYRVTVWCPLLCKRSPEFG